MKTIKISNTTSVWNAAVAGQSGWLSNEIFTGNTILSEGALDLGHQGGLSGGNVPQYFGWSAKPVGVGSQNHQYRLLARVPGHDWVQTSPNIFSQGNTFNHPATADRQPAQAASTDYLQFTLMREAQYAFLLRIINNTQLTADNFDDDWSLELKVFI